MHPITRIPHTIFDHIKLNSSIHKNMIIQHVSLSKFSLFVVSILFSINIFGQQFHSCATDHELIIPRLEENIAYIASNPVNTRAGDPLYAPIKFHRVGTTEGNDYIPITSVLDNMCRLGREFSSYSDIVPYIADNDFGTLNSSTVFNAPQSSGAVSRMRSAFDNTAINVFIPNQISDTGIGTILGYYTPFEDFLVMRKLEVFDSTSTLGHELGHFFSLAHPFLGWESGPYDPNVHGNPVDVLNHPISGALIELVDRDNGNCQFAADRLCDTPAAYLFGFANGTTINNCTLGQAIFDNNGDRVEPMTTNIMDYYPGCDNYEFTEQQAEVMEADFASNRRSYIRSNYVPNLEEITEVPDLIFPKTGDVAEAYNSVFLEWTAVENADRYLVEIQNVFTGIKLEYLTDSNVLWTQDLEPDSKYAWFVHPFNETSACLKTAKNIFDTGSALTSVNEITEINTLEIYPNPAGTTDNIALAIDSESPLDVNITITSINGQVTTNQQSQVRSGANTINLNVPQTPGVYIISIQHENGIATKRFVRQ